MGESSSPVVDPELQRTVVVLATRLAVLALVAYWCFRIFQPFLMVVVWGIILAVALDPVVSRVTRWVGGRRRLAVTLLVLLGLTALLVPAFVLTDSLVEGVHGLTTVVESGSVEIPPPPARVADWPVIGDAVYETWILASQNVGAALEKFAPQVKAFVVWSVLVSLSDAVLKPLFMGRGAEIPGAVILVGAIGGLLLHGVIGLFVGAVVFSIGYELIREWMTTSEGLATPVGGSTTAPPPAAGEA